MKISASMATFKPALKNRRLSTQKPQTAKTPLPIINKIHFNLEEEHSVKSELRNISNIKQSRAETIAIQEIRLENSKWLIFNEEKEDRKVRYAAISSLKRKAIPKLKKNGNRVARRMTTNENSHSLSLADKTQKENQSQTVLQQNARKSPQKSEKAKGKRVNIHTDIKEQSKQKTSLHKSKLLKGGKSNRSYKSLKSVQSSKTLKTPKKSVGKQQLQQENPIVQPQEISHIKQEEHKTVQITRLFNEIELICPSFEKRLTTNIYDDFPEWTASLPLRISPQPSMTQTFERPIIDEFIKQEDHKWKYDEVRAYLQNISQQILQDLKFEEIISKIEEERHVIKEKEEMERIKENNFMQCLTTKETEIEPQDKKQEKLSPYPFQIQQISTKQVSFKDVQFNILRQFTTFKEVRLIKIDPNPQTALFPCKFITQFIRPIPSTSQLHSHYRNDQMISFLNHLLFAQPSTLSSIFQIPSKSGFKCNLFDNKEVTQVTVDGYIPFDNNYYPLFGYFDQFIWFSVLIKCVAKMKGTYKALNALQSSDIYELLTGFSLINLQFNYQDIKALKDFKIIYKSSQAKAILMTVKKSNTFYKVMKIESNKIPPKSRLNHYRSCKSMKSSNGLSQDNFKSLSNFLQREKKVYELNETYENTILYLKGFQSKRRMTFRQFVEQGFQVYISDKIQANTNTDKARQNQY